MMNEKKLTTLRLKNMLVKACKVKGVCKATNLPIEFWYGNTRLEIKEIEQFSLLPNVVIRFRKQSYPEEKK